MQGKLAPMGVRKTRPKPSPASKRHSSQAAAASASASLIHDLRKQIARLLTSHVTQATQHLDQEFKRLLKLQSNLSRDLETLNQRLSEHYQHLREGQVPVLAKASELLLVGKTGGETWLEVRADPARFA